MHTHKSTERRRYCMYRYTHKHAQYYPCLLAKSLQLYPTLCNPMDCSSPGSSVHGISQQEYWSGLPFFPPGDLPDTGIKLASPASPALQVDYLLLSHWVSPIKLRVCTNSILRILQIQNNQVWFLCFSTDVFYVGVYAVNSCFIDPFCIFYVS